MSAKGKEADPAKAWPPEYPPEDAKSRTAKEAEPKSSGVGKKEALVALFVLVLVGIFVALILMAPGGDDSER